MQVFFVLSFQVQLHHYCTMDVQQINYFIKNPLLYEEAIAFIQSIQPHHPALPKLLRGYSPINEVFLIKALKDLKKINSLKQKVSIKARAPELPLETVIPEKPKPTKHPNENKIIQDLRTEKAALWAKASSAQTLLCITNKTSERFNLARLIVESFDRHVEIMDELTYFDQHQQLPKSYTQTDNRKHTDSLKRLYTLRTYISRYKNKMNRCTSQQQKIIHQQKLNEYAFELENLEHEIGIR